MKKSLIALSIVGSMLPVITQAASSPLSFTKQWTYQHDIASEISSYDASTNSIWVAGVTGVDILNLNSGLKTGHIDISSFGSINSVDIHNGVAAFAIENKTRTDAGTVRFYDTKSQSLIKKVTVGALPDNVKFTADGSKLLVANEGTPDVYGPEIGNTTPKNFGPAANDPKGSVSIIDTSTYNVVTAGLDGITETGTHIRKNTGMDFEPEYIAVNKAGTKAYVSLQEANAIGVVDIKSGKFEKVMGLGAKDFSLDGNEIDIRNKDGEIKFEKHNLKGLYMPDSIETYEKDGKTYIITANEGDFREDDGDAIRGKDLGLDKPYDRIKLSATDSTKKDLYVPGARSFSIFDEDGNIVFDSGNILEVEAARLGIYNDSRSDDKGVEPEGVSVIDILGSTYAFIGLERTTKSALAVFDITDPANSIYLDMIVSDGDISPEGIEAFTANGQTFLSFSNEKSNTTSLFKISAVPVPPAFALLLSGLGFLGFTAKLRKRS